MEAAAAEEVREVLSAADGEEDNSIVEEEGAGVESTGASVSCMDTVTEASVPPVNSVTAVAEATNITVIIIEISSALLSFNAPDPPNAAF